MIENSVVQTIAESIEHELDRVKAARPSLASRVERAENILAVHLSCRRQNLIKVRVSNGGARFLVSGSKGAVHVVDPASWSCTCPDHHRRGSGCKHSIACWALWRAGASRPALSGLTHVGDIIESAIRPVATCVSCGDRRLVEDLVEAVEGDNLTHDAGTRFCRPCVLSSGVSF